MTKNDCYYLGKITKRHGFKGNLIIHLDTDEPELYDTLEAVFIEKDGTLVPFFFETSQPYQGTKLLVKFEDIEDEEVDKLINRELYLPLKSLPELSGTDFYYHEIVGFTIYDQTNTEVGTIKSVNDSAAQAYFEVDANGKEILIPMIDEWILEVNREEKAMLINIPDGLLEIYLG
ncbi:MULTISPECIES: ribosome maturation factor RimM [unclassified Empedobacter]|uniref:ribosome maturation factor RimM n=1 Tax=unclassified Empedobacter TaxID=2643773 RepID=UPI002578ACC5|nr:MULTISPECIES: ribosome maturation factor RimM [unclassified Empedobacter]MDM1523193.1 16S rRNA processing protein RimM [Empedobacter sp. 225-1]MDM1543133.1 16S rRNA processing protein RimM [Empedobacter sp. 189-2]